MMRIRLSCRLLARPAAFSVSALLPLVLSSCGAKSNSASPVADAGSDATTVTATDAASDAPSADADAGISARANGSVGPWQKLRAHAAARANHCGVRATGYLVVLGGNYLPDGSSNFVDTDAVDVAALHSDGSLGAWTQAGETPSPVSGCTATAQGSTIYLVDGIFDDMTSGQQVWSATLSAAGVLGAWTSLAPLPDGMDALYSDAWVTGGASPILYTMNPQITGGVAALHAPVSPTFGAWGENAWLPEFLGHPEFAFTGAYVYAIGGYTVDDRETTPSWRRSTAHP